MIQLIYCSKVKKNVTLEDVLDFSNTQNNEYGEKDAFSSYDMSFDDARSVLIHFSKGL